MIISNGSIRRTATCVGAQRLREESHLPFFLLSSREFQGFVKFHTSRFLSDWQWSRYMWMNVLCNMIGQWYLKGQSNDAIHNRYVKTKTTQERLLRRTLHTWSSSFFIHRRKLEKDRSWLKRERNFAQKNECALVAQVHGHSCAIFSNNATVAQGAWLCQSLIMKKNRAGKKKSCSHFAPKKFPVWTKNPSPPPPPPPKWTLS